MAKFLRALTVFQVCVCGGGVCAAVYSVMLNVIIICNWLMPLRRAKVCNENWKRRQNV